MRKSFVLPAVVTQSRQRFSTSFPAVLFQRRRKKKRTSSKYSKSRGTRRVCGKVETYSLGTVVNQPQQFTILEMRRARTGLPVHIVCPVPPLCVFPREPKTNILLCRRDGYNIVLLVPFNDSWDTDTRKRALRPRTRKLYNCITITTAMTTTTYDSSIIMDYKEYDASGWSRKKQITVIMFVRH